MLYWFKKLFKKDIVQQVNLGEAGQFEYHNIVSCPHLKGEWNILTKTNFTEEQPYWKCYCGKKLSFFKAPLVENRTLGKVIFTTRRGENMRIEHGDGHQVRLGKTFVYNRTFLNHILLK